MDSPGSLGAYVSYDLIRSSESVTSLRDRSHLLCRHAMCRDPDRSSGVAVAGTRGYRAGPVPVSM